MRLAATSDTHGMLDRAILPEADALLIAGDYLPNCFGPSNRVADARFQVGWLSQEIKALAKLPFKYKIWCAGNHDFAHQESSTDRTAKGLLASAGIIYLQDEAIELDGVKFYASPWTPYFWNWAFQLPEGDRLSDYSGAIQTWAKIPQGTDVLITHGPPHRILDKCPDGRKVGCPKLRERVFDVKPKLHCFGHIHDAYGVEVIDGVKFANVALCDEAYDPVNPVQVFEV